MNIISIDTMSSRISITVETEVNTVTEILEGNSRKYAEKLIPLMDSVIEKAGIKPTDIEVILGSEGPGAFTGLRLGYATAKAIQLKTNAKFLPVPTLECMANTLDLWDGQILTLIDAKRNCYYGQLFENNEATSNIYDQPFIQYLDLINFKKKCIILGVGVSNLKNEIQSSMKENITLIEYSGVPALDMLSYFHKNKDKMLALPKLSDALGPVYIRKSDAEKM